MLNIHHVLSQRKTWCMPYLILHFAQAGDGRWGDLVPVPRALPQSSPSSVPLRGSQNPQMEQGWESPP